jgi:tRNA (guanine-N7-)-methyltransferase
MPSPSANRLPVTDPGYLYSDSKNPYREKNRQFDGRVFSDNETEHHKGQWRAKFPKNENAPAPEMRELHVEIGCNAGHVSLEWAARDPKSSYIGIDWKFKPIFWGIEKALKRDIKNLVFLRAHAERLPFMFAPQEIDRLYLYFPDPWPKKKQLKNRFLTAQTLIRIAPLMKKGGIFHIKTDHAGYFEWMLEHVEIALKEAGPIWEVIDKNHDLHAGHPNPTSLQIPEVTLFERLFIKDGIKINSLKLRAL